MKRNASLLNQSIAIGSREQLLGRAAELLFRGGSIATVNPIMLTDALRSGELFFALRGSLLIPDGVGVVKALSKRGIYTEALPGVELCESLLDIGEPSFAILGGKEGVAPLAEKYLVNKHKGATCLFTFCGYGFSEEEIKRRLEETHPDIFLVCLGSPRQEILIDRLKSHSPRTLFIGLGGSLDIYSGRLMRAPRVFRALGLEWLFRMLREPRRIKKIPTLIDFIWLCRLERRRKGRSLS